MAHDVGLYGIVFVSTFTSSVASATFIYIPCFNPFIVSIIAPHRTISQVHNRTISQVHNHTLHLGPGC